MFYNFALGCPFESLSRLNVFSTSKNIWNMVYNDLPRLQEKDWLRRHLHAGMLVLREQVVNALPFTLSCVLNTMYETAHALRDV